MNLKLISAALLTVAAGTVSAQDIITTQNNPWEGFYIGGNIGGAWNHTCQSWEPGTAITGGGNPGLAGAFYNRDCPNNGNFIGGIQLGYNFQYNQIVWGFGADYDAVGSKSKTLSYTYTGTAPPPPGTYAAYGKIAPNGIGILGPRIGYAIDEWLPYFRVGGAFAGGQHNSTLSYTPAAGDTTDLPATFSGGKNFKSSGYAIGVGLDYNLPGSWSARAEYNYVNLGKGTNSTFTCTASAAVCATYSNFSLDNIHNSFTMNLFRVGVNYRF
jgi:outer membrane immunogenic protein